MSKPPLPPPLHQPLGIYRHCGGGEYRVLFTMRDSTNGPDEGRTLVCYLSLTTGQFLAREHSQFNEYVYYHGVTAKAYSAAEYLQMTEQGSWASHEFSYCRRFELQKAA